MSEASKQQAWQLFRTGQLDESRRITHEQLNANPDDAQLRLLDGLIYAKQRQFAEAETSFIAALQLQRGYQVLLSLGQLYMVIGDLVKSEQFLLEAIEHESEGPEAMKTLANLYAHLGKHEQAVDRYQVLADKGLADADIFGNMALSMEMLRREEDARHAATEALLLESAHPGAHLVLARLDRRNNNEQLSIPRLQQAVIANQNTIESANLLSELGHALDRMADYESAFDAFQRANDIWSAVARKAPFGKELYQQRIDNFRNMVEKPAWGPAPDDFGDRLVFFVGFPRSGTTLVEQVLKTRPEIVTTQEEPLVTDLIKQLTGGERNLSKYPAVLAGLCNSDLTNLRKRYVSNLQQVTGTGEAGVLYIDKLPLNIIEAGFIRKLFPAARFLVALRDPRDVCLSCFMQSFRLNPAMLHFLRLDDAARFYAATMGLWNHYKNVFDGLRYYEYRYEDLVGDFDGTSKRILEFVGAEWTPDVRLFHEQARSGMVRTPSYIDVSTPLYARAVGRWRHYAKQIGSVEEILMPFVEQFGYLE